MVDGTLKFDKLIITDELSYKAVILNHLTLMSKELATDGFYLEYEDMVDTLIDFLWPYLNKERKEKIVEIDKIGNDVPIHEKLNFEKVKRERIRKKKRVAMGQLRDLDLLLKQRKQSRFDFDAETPWEKGSL